MRLAGGPAALIALGSAAVPAGAAPRIAFTTTVSGRSTIVTAAEDGSDRRSVVVSGSADVTLGAPAFSRDGMRLAYVASRSPADEDRDPVDTLHVAAADGTADRALTGPRADGRMAFVRVRQVAARPAEPIADILVAPAGGGPTEVVVRDGDEPAWSPDGARLAFSSTRDRNGQSCGSDECFPRREIYVAAADGSGARRITRTPADDGEPVFSADGTRVAFTSTRMFPEGDAGELYVADPDGGCAPPGAARGRSSSAKVPVI